MSTESKILQILSKSQEVRLSDLVEMTGYSRQMVHRAVKRLLEVDSILKLGTAPKTFYSLKPSRTKQTHRISEVDQRFLHEHFFLVTETGTPLTGVDAMIHWCKDQGLPIEKTASEFIRTKKKYLAYFMPNGLIDGSQKIRSTKGLERIGLDKVYYLDFYALERFGKTHLGSLLHFAKQGQNKKLMDEIIDLSRKRINELISTEKVDAVGYIPPTIRREVQFMKVLERKLNLPLPHIELLKVRGEITIPQKALSKISDRVNNARFSILVGERRKFKRVLLIDDAVGSGATLNETALKLKDGNVAVTVLGLAITGSFKGFEVIQEV